MQVLRKLLKHMVEGNTETNVFERIEKEVLTDQEVQELIDQFDDDPEQAYSVYGMGFADDEIIWLDLDTLSSGLKDYLREQDDDEKNTTLENILKKVEPLHQYHLHFETVITVPAITDKSISEKGD